MQRGLCFYILRFFQTAPPMPSARFFHLIARGSQLLLCGTKERSSGTPASCAAFSKVSVSCLRPLFCIYAQSAPYLLISVSLFAFCITYSVPARRLNYNRVGGSMSTLQSINAPALPAHRPVFISINYEYNIKT